MTLETAKRIVLEQGENASKEARAVVKGGMTICELSEDGRRTYPWIKVMPTKTDGESSIEQALKIRHWKNTKSKQRPVETPAKSPRTAPVQTSHKEELPKEKDSFSINSFISKKKQRLLEMWKEIDEILVE